MSCNVSSGEPKVSPGTSSEVASHDDLEDQGWEYNQTDLEMLIKDDKNDNSETTTSGTPGTPQQDFIAPPDVPDTEAMCRPSESASFCRICQDNETTQEPISCTECGCKGQLSLVHRSCLVEWVRYRGSNRCEICAANFRCVPAPALGFGLSQLDTTEALQRELAQYQPLSRRKRSTIAGVILFLFVVSGVIGVVTVGADEEFQTVNSDPYASEAEVKKTHVMFSICLAFLFFCLTLTIGLTLAWFLLELYFYVNRRRVYRNTAWQMLTEARRRSEMWRSTVV
ncbi:E3 ubiquitin-protein ligase MARCHF11-like [Dreissena polymorpha]|uniref:RING-CH-type domain-containing protein n=1 Tax=Dreissena polymorpha TaxID=45954 RepID=A0A9D4GKV7_DREPO|nr:E3 ubiquitin-protein ligase MARCHF11-like [Dreissena polymorpha]KAH3819039.1 hypothetical protein DPMN_120769 [Dreissena polymorpha]